jgi:probable addiction module antidote protein
MPKRTGSYRDALLQDLRNPVEAANYLNAAFEDSEEVFLAALRDVATSQLRSMSDIAEQVGVSRETLYRIMAETGNPTFSNLTAVLSSVGLRMRIEPMPLPAQRRARH